MTRVKVGATRRAVCTGLAGLPLLPARAAAGLTRIRGTDPRLQLEGRGEVTAPGTVSIAYPGIVLRFAGDAGEVALACRASSENCYIDVVVNGGTPRTVKLAKGEQRVPLITGRRMPRLVEVKHRTSPGESRIDIMSVETDGMIAAPPPLPRRRLLFIGDSITCGSTSDWPDLSAPEGHQHDNGDLSYGAELARRLKAQRHLVAYGGRGVFRDSRGGLGQTNAVAFYDRTLPNEETSRWDPAGYVPHAVGICLGTNDFGIGIPDQAEFVLAYVELVSKVRRDAPGAPIIVIDSPMTTDSPAAGPRRTVQRAYLDQAVRRCASPLVRRAALSVQPGRPGRDAHPTGPQHRAIADELEPVFRAALAI